MVYVKNPNYYNADKVKIERLEFMLSADDAAIFAAYKSGDLQFIDTVPTDEIAGLLDSPEFNIVDQLGTYYVTFNVKSGLFEGKTPAQANAMRKAMALLIDRGYIAENIGQTGQQPANAFIPAKMMDGHGASSRPTMQTTPIQTKQQLDTLTQSTPMQLWMKPSLFWKKLDTSSPLMVCWMHPHRSNLSM